VACLGTGGMFLYNKNEWLISGLADLMIDDNNDGYGMGLGLRTGY